MAWQNSTAMGNGGGPGSAAEGGNNGGQSHGTEYTLQGTSDCFSHHRHIIYQLAAINWWPLAFCPAD